jgi:hypothetical protein
MQQKFFVLGAVAVTFLIACGPATAEANELTDVGEPALSEQQEPVKQEQGPSIQAYQIIGPQGLGQLPSWWPGATNIMVESYGPNFEETPVHMWCTTGSNDVSFTVYPGQLPWVNKWYCYGRTIYVRNHGTNFNQTIQVTTW